MNPQDRIDAQVVVNLYRGGMPLQEAVVQVALLRRARNGGDAGRGSGTFGGLVAVPTEESMSARKAATAAFVVTIAAVFALCASRWPR